MVQGKNDGTKILAKNVKKYRKSLGISQVELANLIETEVSTISRIERGVYRTNIETIFTIALALNIKPYQLLEY